ncbi:hypothetical protein CDD80_2759 [Ophiocordyceps camponoti-rufipedis]|uniref:Uncharacterized protein n=1 Tax=Ophiocordyceps camponoti-rufipedis TaxID=2004952 RepID=A0A2C5XJS3_9HYPO|nr:hypothetical protein CDD80_2759 [Ophiocordyceps camponoti-rufipedis]
MCLQIVELYAACHCLYYQHAVDRCPSYGRHGVEKRTVYVGYACSRHSSRAAQQAAPHNYSDSGYHSAASDRRGYR